jgi:hypothetical protein
MSDAGCQTPVNTFGASLLLLLFAVPAYAVIGMDTTATSVQCVSLSCTVSITVGNNANRVIILFVGRTNGNMTITGATGVKGGADTAMTQFSTTGTQPLGVHTFRLVAPDIGVNTVKWTQSTTSLSAQSMAVALSYFGVDPITPIDKIVSAGPIVTSTPSAGSITPTNDHAWVVDFLFRASNSSFLNSGTWTPIAGSSGPGDTTKSSGKGPISPPSAQVNTYGTPSDNWIAAAIAINPVLPTCFVTRSTLPDWNVGSAFSQTITTTGCTAPAFSISSGTLPVGLSLSSAGVISGTPTTADGVPAVVNTPIGFTVVVADASGTPSQALSMKIQRTWGFGQ